MPEKIYLQLPLAAIYTLSRKNEKGKTRSVNSAGYAGIVTGAESGKIWKRTGNECDETH
jgi:hypothetical protein